MNRWYISLLRLVIAFSVLFLAGLFSILVGLISHSPNGLLPGIAFLSAFLCLLLLAMRSFPSVYSGLRRPRPWWQTRAIEAPIGMAFALIVSILSSRIATLWFGLLSISALLVAVLVRVTNKHAEFQVLLAMPDAGPDNHFQVVDRVHSRPARRGPKLAAAQIHQATSLTQSWRKPPFFIPDNYAIDVHNLAAACEWYKEKLGFHEVRDRREDDSGRPFVDLQLSEETLVSLVELLPGEQQDNRNIIFFSKDLEKTYRWLSERGVLVEPMTADSGGNRLFRFLDLEGNAIEVCTKPE